VEARIGFLPMNLRFRLSRIAKLFHAKRRQQFNSYATGLFLSTESRIKGRYLCYAKPPEHLAIDFADRLFFRQVHLLTNTRPRRPWRCPPRLKGSREPIVGIAALGRQGLSIVDGNCFQHFDEDA
jgi:hypothetical protein